MKKLSNSGINKLLHEMSNKRLIRREVAGRDSGFKLLVSGYDFLALKALVKQNYLSALGNQIGVGKESDVYVGMTDDKEVCVKLHRYVNSCCCCSASISFLLVFLLVLCSFSYFAVYA